MKLVSIIIPCFNAGPLIARCVNSCFEQTYPNIEIILIDNNSTDDSVAIARSAAKKANKTISIFECKKQGRKYARSMGNNIAKGEYIQLLDADDELGPDKIASQVDALEKSTDYSVAYCNWKWRFYQPDGTDYTATFLSRQYDNFLLQLLLDNWHPPHVYLYRREVVEKTNPLYSENCETAASEDREFISFAALTGARFLYTPETFVYYNNWSDQQVTRKVTNSARAESLSQVFDRLRKYARQQPKVNLKEIHWRLLDQSWQLYTLAAGEIPASSSIFKITAEGKEASIKISPIESLIISALQKYSEPFWLEHHARQILRMLHHGTLQMLKINQNSPKALSTMVASVNQLLAFKGDRTNAPAELYRFDQDQVLNMTNPLNNLSFLLNGPLYLPMFAMQRLVILEVLQGLCDKGILSKGQG